MKDEIQNKLITLLFRLHFLSYFTHRWQSKLEVRLEISFLEQQPNIDGEKMLWELVLLDSNISQMMCLVILLTFLLDHTSIFLGEIKWCDFCRFHSLLTIEKSTLSLNWILKTCGKSGNGMKRYCWKATISLLLLFFFSFCPMYIADSELGIIILIHIFILSGASFALVKRISIVYFKKCRITSLTRSKRVVTSLLKMIQEFCRQRILTGIISRWWISPVNKATLTVQWRATYISSHQLFYGCRPQGSLSQYCQILTVKDERNVC